MFTELTGIAMEVDNRPGRVPNKFANQNFVILTCEVYMPVSDPNYLLAVCLLRHVVMALVLFVISFRIENTYVSKR